MIPRTSESDPLFIDSFQPGDSTGLIGMTFCPGKKDLHANTGAWERDLNLDLDAVVRWGATAVVSLMTEGDFHNLKVPVSDFKKGLESRRLRWFHLPIEDGHAPDDQFRLKWDAQVRREIHEILDGGHNVMVHCRGGLGRTGTIAAQLLVEYGSSREGAISQVRRSRKGAIETRAQENYIRELTFSEELTVQSDTGPALLPRCPVCGTDKTSEANAFNGFRGVAWHIASKAVGGGRRHMEWASERFDGPGLTQSTLPEYVRALTEIARIEQPLPAETPAGGLDEIQFKIDIATAAITVERGLSTYIRTVFEEAYGRSEAAWWVLGIKKPVRDKCNSKMEDCR
jgi:protein-tyrosine phosphatase